MLNTRNFGDYINSFYRIKFDPQRKMFPEEAVKEWINDAITDICNRTGVLEIEQKQYTVANRKEYLFPNEILKPVRLTYNVDTNPLTERTFEEIDALFEDIDLTESGTPSDFVIFRNTIILYPTPDTSGVVLHLYSRRLHDKLVNLDDRINIKIDRYNKAILQFCKWRAEQRAGNDVSSNADYELYERFLQEVNTGKFPTRTGPKRIKTVDELSTKFYPNL